MLRQSARPMSFSNVPVAAIRRQISAAIHVVVQISRKSDGSRKITHITEVIPEIDAAGKYMLQDIFLFVQRGRTKEGKIVGEMVPTGVIPSFMREIEINRLPFPRQKFAPPAWYVEMVRKDKKVA